LHELFVIVYYEGELDPCQVPDSADSMVLHEPTYLCA